MTLFGFFLLWLVLGAVIYYGSPDGRLVEELYGTTPRDKPERLSLGNRLNAFYLALWMGLYFVWIALKERDTDFLWVPTMANYVLIIKGRKVFHDEW